MGEIQVEVVFYFEESFTYDLKCKFWVMNITLILSESGDYIV